MKKHFGYAIVDTDGDIPDLSMGEKINNIYQIHSDKKSADNFLIKSGLDKLNWVVKKVLII